MNKLIDEILKEGQKQKGFRRFLQCWGWAAFLYAANEKIAEAVVGGYKKIEEGVVEGYKKIESGVVEGFEKVTNKCVEKLFAKDGESVENAKKRLSEMADRKWMLFCALWVAQLFDVGLGSISNAVLKKTSLV